MDKPTYKEGAEVFWNLVSGCSQVSEGCKNCHAQVQAGRLNRPGQIYSGLTIRTEEGAKWTGDTKLSFDLLMEPLKWVKPRNVLVAPLSDLFHENVPDAFIDKVFAVMALCSQHRFVLQTKRAKRLMEYCQSLKTRPYEVASALMEDLKLAPYAPGSQDFHTADGDIQNVVMKGLLPNLSISISIENQAAADERLPALLATPAAEKSVDVSPLLGMIDLKLMEVSDLAWISVSGEAGPGSRPMHPDWVRSIRDQCSKAGIPFVFPQWGDWVPVAIIKQTPEVDQRPGHEMAPYKTMRLSEARNEQLHCVETGSTYLMSRVGKKASGRVLDGKIWDEVHQKSAFTADTCPRFRTKRDLACHA